MKCFLHILWKCHSEVDWDALTQVQQGLVVLLGAAVTAELLRLAVLDVRGQGEKVLGHGDLLDVGQDKTALSRDRDGDWI